MPATLSPPEMQQRDLIVRQLPSPTSFNEDERSFESVVATEEPTLVFDMRTFDIIEEVLVADGGQFPQSMPLLDNHNRHSIFDILGSGREFRQQKTRWLGRGVLGTSEQGEAAFNLIRETHLDSVSIGYQVLKFRDLSPGESFTINGRTFKARDQMLRISHLWRALELSLTPIPADKLSKIRKQPGHVAQINRSIFR